MPWNRCWEALGIAGRDLLARGLYTMPIKVCIAMLNVLNGSSSLFGTMCSVLIGHESWMTMFGIVLLSVTVFLQSTCRHLSLPVRPEGCEDAARRHNRSMITKAQHYYHSPCAGS